MHFAAPVIFGVLFLFLSVTRLAATDGAVPVNAASEPAFSRAAAFAVSKPRFAEPAITKPRGNLPVRELGFSFLELQTDSRPALFGGGPAPLAAFSSLPMPQPLLSFPGLSNLDNALEYNLLFAPADMTGDVGPDHYVQVVNSLFRVYGKSGQPLTSPARLSSLFVPLGTTCSTRNDGLPVVLYDQLADRWIISQQCVAFPPFRQMIAVSKTGDPAGEYYVYEFIMPNNRLNDFPKLGVWPDAYYMATDEFFGADFYGSGIFAFDRERMLAGDPAAGYVYFSVPSNVQIRRKGFLPADLDGMRAPRPDAPGIFATYTANEYGDAADTLRLFEFRADFAAPEKSAFTERPESPVAVSPVDPTSPEGRADIAQPPPGEFLDSQSDRINYRLAFREFATHRSLVVNQTARVTPQDSTYRAGVRVYELRDSGQGFSPVTDATIGTTDASRWVGSAAQDHEGNLAVQYNFASEEKRPSILYSGRLASDPANTFRIEGTLITGTGVQKAFGFRWGEYSGMSVDPVDDCTFWLTNGYYSLQSEQWNDLGWLTQIGAFKFDECTPAPRGRLSGTVRRSDTNSPITSARVDVVPVNDVGSTPFTRFADAAGGVSPMIIPPAAYRVTAAAPGYRESSVNVTVDQGTGTAEFAIALDPVAVLAIADFRIVAESCDINGTPEPGETVSAEVTVRNDGAAMADAVSGSLLGGGGVLSSGPAQDFGSIEPGGAVTRVFSFAVSGSVNCGAELRPTIRFSANGGSLGDFPTALTAGRRRVVFSENFDGVAAPALPEGWSTSTTENHQLWRTSTARFESGGNSAFSPAPIQRGVNELVSPQFTIETSDAEVRFRNWYELETTFLRNRLYDGSVLEIKIGSGDWQDILAAGGRFLSGGYVGTIDGCCNNPLAGRAGWSGRSGPNQASIFIDTVAKLPPAAAGNTVRLRWRVGSDIGGFREGQYLDNIVVTDGFACSCGPTSNAAAQFDFDGDGRTDIGTASLSDDGPAPDISILRSSDNTVATVSFGSAADILAPADLDGDGRTDVAVFRPASGEWWFAESSTGNVRVVQFGVAGDIPLPNDHDGDGTADIAVYRPATGTWYILNSSDGSIGTVRFGLPADIPAPADYDGDGKTDLAVFRPATGEWYILRSTDASVAVTRFGVAGDVPSVGDHDGDGRADIVLFRPADGAWYLNRSRDGFLAVRFGLAGDRPLQGDLDGDGRSDIAVFRPATAVWYLLPSAAGQVSITAFGATGSAPIPGTYVRP